MPVRRTRSSTGSRRSSAGSSRSMHDDSDDTLHTIVYEKEFVQSILNDSSELADSRRSSRANVTIPETPDASEESESEPETKKKGKNKRNAKKK